MRFRGVALGFALMLCTACGGAQRADTDPLAAAREAAAEDADAETLGRWMMSELVLPGGDPKRVRLAAKTIEERGVAGLYTHLAIGVDAEAHGDFRRASDAFMALLQASRTSARPEAPLFGWFAAHHLLGLRASVPGLWDAHAAAIEGAIESPGGIGWRARGDLVEWWSVDALQGSGAEDPLADVAKAHGCIDQARFAGPFGTGAPADHTVEFSPEQPGPWPALFKKEERQSHAPAHYEGEDRGCRMAAPDAAHDGIYYVETYFEIDEVQEVIVAVQGAFSVRVDDTEVLRRDVSTWGVWSRFGSAVRLEPGRHRIVARLGAPQTSIRVLTREGLPADLIADADPRPPYSSTPPRKLADPNVLEPFLRDLAIPFDASVSLARPSADPSDPLVRYVAAYLAHVEGQDDVASVLMEPLVKEPSKSSGPALSAAAVYIETDPIFADGDARDLAKDLRQQALSKDAKLWWPNLWLALERAEREGVAQTVSEVEQLAETYPEVPDIRKGLISLYARLGWTVERAEAIRAAAKKYPDDPEVLGYSLALYEEEGQFEEADAVKARIRKLEPLSEIDLQDALARRDYDAAIAELGRLGELSTNAKIVEERIFDLETRAGREDESIEKLELAVELDPMDEAARLALADARYATGDDSALRNALIEAIESGAETDRIRDAIELVEGMNELTPFREDGLAIIEQFEASGAAQSFGGGEPAAGIDPAGTASRVLDYAVLWVHTDGTARMLEHEILHMASREAIAEHAEQRIPNGQLLKLRTVKRDGTIFEPEFIQGKPTVTMPHLEQGDYIEMETIYALRGGNESQYVSPRWFFREEKLGYWLSEFVTITPTSKDLQIEISGDVPEAAISESGGLRMHRWRVDKSPALPEEPGSAPLTEFLPSVRVGWGNDIDEQLEQLARMTESLTPHDPRLVRIAQTIVSVGGVSGKNLDKTPTTDAERARVVRELSADEKARRLYRWVLSNVEPSRESDGRRAVVGKSGNPLEAFLYLCRLVGVEPERALVKSRLAPPPIGPISEAESFGALAVTFPMAGDERRWLIVEDKFAPYAYLPSSLRGQPAVILDRSLAEVTTASTGATDGVTHAGSVELSSDGSATIELSQKYEGQLAISLRAGLESLPEGRLKDAIESKLLPQALPGARLRDIEVKNLEDLDRPLVLRMRIDVGSFAERRGNELIVDPPFVLNLKNLAVLPERETPLFIGEQLANRVEVKLAIHLPEGARPASDLAPSSVEDGERKAIVSDRFESGTLYLDRILDLPAGRVQPADYPAFVQFANEADAVTHRPIRLMMP